MVPVVVRLVCIALLASGTPVPAEQAIADKTRPRLHVSADEIGVYVPRPGQEPASNLIQVLGSPSRELTSGAWVGSMIWDENGIAAHVSRDRKSIAALSIHCDRRDARNPFKGHITVGRHRLQCGTTLEELPRIGFDVHRDGWEMRLGDVSVHVGPEQSGEGIRYFLLIDRSGQWGWPHDRQLSSKGKRARALLARMEEVVDGGSQPADLAASDLEREGPLTQADLDLLLELLRYPYIRWTEPPLDYSNCDVAAAFTVLGRQMPAEAARRLRVFGWYSRGRMWYGGAAEDPSTQCVWRTLTGLGPAAYQDIFECAWNDEERIATACLRVLETARQETVNSADRSWDVPRSLAEVRHRTGAWKRWWEGESH